MSGHMGAEKVTIQNLKITAINKDLNLIMIKGAVPGPKGSRVVIRASVKK